MGLSAVVRKAVAIADKVTKDLQTTVSMYPWTGKDDWGKPSYAASATSLRAIVNTTQRLYRTQDGREILQKATILILSPITANGASGRREPIDPRDKFVLADGTTGPILDVRGPEDPSTKHPYLYKVILG